MLIAYNQYQHKKIYGGVQNDVDPTINQTQQHTINAQQKNMGKQKGGYGNKIWSKYDMEKNTVFAQENSSNE